jgi:hypothetical protein
MRASKSTLDIIAAWQEPQTINFNGVVYNTSTNGKDFHDAGFIPMPECWGNLYGSDPMVTFKPDGTGYVGYVGFTEAGAMSQGHYDRFWIAKKEPGPSHAYASTAVASLAPLNSTSGLLGRFDKGVLLAGPIPDDIPNEPSDVIVGAVCVADLTNNTSGTPNPKAFRPPDEFDICNDDPVYPTLHDMPLVDFNGSTHTAAPNGVVVLSAGTVKGRWVVGRYHHEPSGPNAYPAHSSGCYSDDLGETWTNSVDPLFAMKADNSDTEAIGWGLDQDSNQPGSVNIRNRYSGNGSTLCELRHPQALC